VAIGRPLQKVLFRTVPIVAAVIAAGCGVFILVMTLRMVVLGWSPTPFWDQWDNIMSGRLLSWSWLVAQWNEHRIFIPRLIFWLDRWLAAETNIFDFALNILIQAAMTALLLWLALKGSAADRATRIWAGGLCLTFLFWAGQYENFLWGFQVQFFGVVLLAAAAFTTVALGPATGFGAAAAALLSGAALYTLASGILVPGLAFVLAIWVGRPRWYWIILLISAVGWSASYLWGYETPRAHSDPAEFFSHSGAVLFYLLVHLGGPFALAVRDLPSFSLAATFGAIGVALFVAGLALTLRHPAKPQQKALATLALYLLGAALLVSLGRVGYGPNQALSSRYSTPVLAFWLSTLLFWFSASANRPRLRLVAFAASAPIVMAAALSEPRMVENGLDFSLGRKLATPAILTDVNDSKLSNLYPHPDRLAERRALLLRFHTSLFAEGWTRLIGAKFGEHFVVNGAADCSGSFRRVQPIDEGPSGWSAVGTAWREGSRHPLRQIVLVGGDDRIVGYALGGFDSSSLGEEAYSEASAKPVWWTGDFGPTDPASVRAYAVDEPTGACLIASNPRTSPRAIALAPLPSPTPERGGFFDSITTDDRGLTIVGWGYLSSGDGQVLVDTDLPVRKTSLKRMPRPDVVRASNDASLRTSGIEVRLSLEPNSVDKNLHRLCVWTDDPKFGRRTLNDYLPTTGARPYVCDARR
jgi:hypothetical protein